MDSKSSNIGSESETDAEFDGLGDLYALLGKDIGAKWESSGGGGEGGGDWGWGGVVEDAFELERDLSLSMKEFLRGAGGEALESVPDGDLDCLLDLRPSIFGSANSLLCREDALWNEGFCPGVTLV